jgi:hypothetical protein
MASNASPEISCVSLGMVIVDEIHLPGRNRPLAEVLGGSASFVTLGQRLFASIPEEIGCLIIAGNEFPPAIRGVVEHWGVTLLMKVREGQNSTRGKLIYLDDNFGCKYIYERIEPQD